MIYCSVKYCCSNSSIPGVILQSNMKSIKTPNHPAYHWSTLWPLEVWVRGLYNNSWWFCVIHKLSMFIYLSMEKSAKFYFAIFIVIYSKKCCHWSKQQFRCGKPKVYILQLFRKEKKSHCTFRVLGFFQLDS